MNNIIKRTWRQGSMVIIEDLRGLAFQAEENGHTFEISAVDRDGAPVALSGTPAGVMLRSDNQDVALTCAVSDGKVTATLPANAYAVPGRFALTIFLTSGGEKMAIYAAVGTVKKTNSGTVAPPAGDDVTDLISRINTAINAIPVNYNAAFAVAYENLTFPVDAGTYCIYDGALKKAIVDIATSETYTSAHWTNANFGQELSSLKSAINSDYVGKKISIIGDSFSAYNDVNYRYPGYAMYYPTSSGSNDVNNVNQMWWKRIIDICGGQFEVNASLASSRATYDSNHSDRPTFYDRVSLLGSPDIIFVELGYFDSQASVPFGDYDFETAYTSLSETEFRPAYIKGVKALQATYPNAKIICIALRTLSGYYSSIRHIAKTLGVGFVRAFDISFKSGAPSIYGMIQLTDRLIHPTDYGLYQSDMPADADEVGNRFEEVNVDINKLLDENGELTGYNPQIYSVLDTSDTEIVNTAIGATAITDDSTSRCFCIRLKPGMDKFIIHKPIGNCFRAAFISYSFPKNSQPVYRRVVNGDGSGFIKIERGTDPILISQNPDTYLYPDQFTMLMVHYYSLAADPDTDPDDIFDSIKVYMGKMETMTDSLISLEDAAETYGDLDSRVKTTDELVSSFINGAKFKKEMETVLTSFKQNVSGHAEMLMHVPCSIIHNDILYLTHIMSYTSNWEYPNTTNVRLAICPMNNLESKTWLDVCMLNDEYDGSYFTHVRDANIAKFVNGSNETIIRITFAAKLASADCYEVFYRDYDLTSGELTEIKRSKFKIFNGETYNFSIINLKEQMTANGIPHSDTNNSTDFPLITKSVSSRTLSSKKYYFAGLGTMAGNFIVRTLDFETWEIVAHIPFEHCELSEVSTYAYASKVYCYIRRDGSYRTLGILTWFDYVANRWGDKCYITDQGSRTMFFTYSPDPEHISAKLYLISNPKERDKIMITRVPITTVSQQDTAAAALMNNSVEVQECALNVRSFYPDVFVYNNELYCIYCYDRQDLKMCKFTIGSITNTNIYAKMDELFNIT